MACSAADSDLFFNNLPNLKNTSDTITFVLNMIGNKAGTKINFNRVLFLLQHFFNRQKNLITGIKMIDA